MTEAPKHDSDHLVKQAKLAEQAERYDDMSDFMKECVKLNEPLGVEVRTCLIDSNIESCAALSEMTHLHNHHLQYDIPYCFTIYHQQQASIQGGLGKKF